MLVEFQEMDFTLFSCYHLKDVLEELCATCLHMEGSSLEERGEWSVYCIVEVKMFLKFFGMFLVV